MKRYRDNGEKRSIALVRYSGLLLAALLILYCAGARRGSLQAHNTSLRPVVRTVYVENNETRLGSALVLLLLAWWLTRAHVTAGAALTPMARWLTDPLAVFVGDFDRALYIRPPPRS